MIMLLAIALKIRYTWLMLEVRLLGLPKILVDENPMKLARRKTRAIFYFLAAQKQPVQRNKLLAIFWADEPRTAAQQVLRTTVYNLRHDLGDYLVVSNDTVGLSEAAIVDVHLFNQGLANAADLILQQPGIPSAPAGR
jgi:DNA-binding SARP family transcriptional activator